MGLRLRFCTGAQDETLRVCAGMKADPGDELTVSQVPKPQTLNRTRVPQSTTLNPYPSPLASSSKLQALKGCVQPAHAASALTHSIHHFVRECLFRLAARTPLARSCLFRSPETRNQACLVGVSPMRAPPS